MKRKIINVLALVEFSVRANKTLHAAASLCARNNARLTLMNVIEVSTFVFPENRLTPTLLPELVAVAEENLSKRADNICRAYGVPVDFYVVCGNAVEEVLRFIEIKKADVVILGIAEGPGVSKLQQESIAVRIAGRTSCPVLSFASVEEPSHYSSTANLVRTKIRLYEHAT